MTKKKISCGYCDHYRPCLKREHIKEAYIDKQKVRDVLSWMKKNPNKYGSAIEHIEKEMGL